ncbi:Annexin A7-like [Oopsacas minuta]|uniref:Annexin A7-like n=1 Tax=Oopsacas minuta TaxID=111878 RepID=A0AAV7JGF2_9METZ|nr:Annexin A7-like [Oopsacas minuta]
MQQIQYNQQIPSPAQPNMYAPPGQPAMYAPVQTQPMYAPNPQVVVIQQNAPTPAPASPPHVEVKHVTYTDNRPNHLLHCIITCFCPWWIFVWILMCCCYGC